MNGSDEIIRRIEQFAANRSAGASELVREAIDILRIARSTNADLPHVARALCEAQPTMASIYNAADAALSEDAGRLHRFAERVRRAPAALGRYAAAHFADDTRQLRVVTLSYSGTVLAACNAIRASRPLHLSCSESRPALEGRRLAAALAADGIPVTCFSDAAIAHGLAGADAVLVGADAVAPSRFFNKSGTRMLAAAAAQQGVPVYVLATRDKFVRQELGDRLLIRSGDPAEIWEAPPPGVEIRNPYFESTPLDLITAVISDVGVLGTGMVPDVCEH